MAKRSGSITIVDVQDIDRIENWYLATNLSSGVTYSTSGWTTTIQTMSSSNPYLWNYEVTYSSLNTVVNKTSPTIIGTYGTEGRGIVRIDEYYARNNNPGVAPADEDFDTVVVAPTSELRYLWNYEVITYTKGNPEPTDKRVIGVYGQDGHNPVVTTTYNSETGVTTILVDGQAMGSVKDGNSVSISSTSYDSTNKITTVVFTNGSQIEISDGRDGQNGAPGSPGQNGKTYYTHIAWMNTIDNSDDSFSTSNEDNLTYNYMGVLIDEEESDSQNYLDYNWSKIRGDRGVSVVDMEIQYYLRLEGEPAPNDNTPGSTTIPEYTGSGSYYTRTSTTYSNSNTPVVSSWQLDEGLTSQQENAYNAFTKSAETEIKVRQVVLDSTGWIVAGGRDSEDIDFDEDDVSTYGYNSIMAPTYLGLRYNAINLSKLTTTGLEFYVPTISNGIPVQGQRGLAINSSAITFYNPSTNNPQLIIGAHGLLQSGNYVYTSGLYSDSGTKIDLINGSIYTPGFRTEGSNTYVRGEINALSGKIGGDTNNYWTIGNYNNYDQTSSAALISEGTAFIQLGQSNTWRLTTDRMHTAWNGTDGSAALMFPKEGNTYWDWGIHAPHQNGTTWKDKFVYVRNYSNTTNDDFTNRDNLSNDLDDNLGLWTYRFYIDKNGSIYARNFYLLNEDGTPGSNIGGNDSVYLLKTGGTISGDLTVNGTLNATVPNATKVSHNLTIQWGAAVTEGTDKFTYNGSATKTITLGNAAIKGVVTAIDTSANLPTSNAVKTYIDNVIGQGVTNAGTGLSKNGNTINHSNSVTAQTTQALYPIKIDAQGHISAYGSAITSLPASDVPAWAKAASKPTYKYSEISGTPSSIKNPNALQIKIYDGSIPPSPEGVPVPSATLSYDGSTSNQIIDVASNNAIVDLDTTIAESTGISTFYITRADGSTENFEVTIVASAASSAEMADKLSVGTVGSTSKPVFFKNGKPEQIGYTIQTSVPSNAVFTDHIYSAGTGLSLSGSTFNISTVPIANGGTGATTARNGFHALSGGLTEGTADVTDDTVFMSGNTNAATNDWYYRKFSHVWNYIKGKTDSNYLKLSGGTVTGAVQINNILTLYREGTTANNYPAGLKFKVKDTTTGKTYDSGYLYAYQDHQSTTYGVNFVLNGGGGLFIGSGESPGAHYSAKGASYSGEDTFITADGTVYIQGNGNTIANRLGVAVNASHQLVPVKADVYTDNVGSIGSGSYYWQHIYGTNHHGKIYNISEKAVMKYDSSLDAIVFSFN